MKLRGAIYNKQQTKSLGIIIIGVVNGAWDRLKVMVEMQTNMFRLFLMNGGYSFKLFNCNGELSQDF